MSSAFDPNTLKISGYNVNEKFYGLCETPRWHKLRCPDDDPNVEWNLIPQLRMCIHMDSREVTYHDAQKHCSDMKSFVAVPRSIHEMDIFRSEDCF